MNSRDESSLMSPTKHFVAIIGPTPISQSDIIRPDDSREDGDLCEEDEGGEGDASWHNKPAGPNLGPLAAIKEEEDSADEKSPKRVYPVDNSLAEKLSYDYFDYPLKEAAPNEKPSPEGKSSNRVVTDLDTDYFGRLRTAERPKTPSPEKREQKKYEPFARPSSPACIDCIVGGKDHHHGRASVQSPPPLKASFPGGSLGSSLKRSSSESISSELTPAKEIRPASVADTTVETQNQSTTLHNPNPTSFTTPQKLSSEAPAPTLRRTGNLPVRELKSSREQGTFPNLTNESMAPVLKRVPTLHRELTPPREQTSLQLSIPTPSKESVSNPYERTPTKPNNPTTPARQRVPAIPPTPPSTPAKRRSLPHDFSKSYPNPPTPVEEEPPTTSTQEVEETRSEHGRSRREEGNGCPWVRSRSRDARLIKSYSYNPETPESVRGLSHSYSAPNIRGPRRSNSLPSNMDPSRFGLSCSRPTTPELSRLSYSCSYSRPGSSDGFRRPTSSDGFRRSASSDGFRRPGSSDGPRSAYPYGRSTTPDAAFRNTGIRTPFGEGSGSFSRSHSPPPPPPTIASSVSTSPATSQHLPPLAPAINFKKDTTQRSMSPSISESNLSAMGDYFELLQRRLALERERENEDSVPESPVEELTPEPTTKSAVPEIPGRETTEPKTTEVVPQSFITEFIIPRITRYYLQGPIFWNAIISFLIFLSVLKFMVTVSTMFVYFLGDGTTSSGLKSALLGEEKLLEDLNPPVAILLYIGLFSWVTVYSHRVTSPEAEKVKKRDLLAEVVGLQQAAWIKKCFSPRKMKMVLLLCLITAGTRGLYLGWQIVGPPIAAGVRKTVKVGVDYWDDIRAPATEISAEVEVEMGMSDPWKDMDLMYFQSTEGKSGKHVSTMEGSQGTYYPGAEDLGYFGDEEELGWGAVVRLGLALFVAPAGAMAAWRHRRTM